MKRSSVSFNEERYDVPIHPVTIMTKINIKKIEHFTFMNIGDFAKLRLKLYYSFL